MKRSGEEPAADAQPAASRPRSDAQAADQQQQEQQTHHGGAAGTDDSGGVMPGYTQDPESGWYVCNTDPSWMYDPTTGLYYNGTYGAYYHLNAEGQFVTTLPPGSEQHQQEPPQHDPVILKSGFSIETALTSMQGKRPTQEDRHVIVEKLQDHCKIPEDISPAAFVSIYDGHLGSGASEFVSQELHKRIFEGLEQLQSLKEEDINEVIVKAFADTDSEYLRIAKIRKHADGSCAVCALVLGRKIFFFHVGDSRAVLSNRGTAVRMTEDHKPDLPGETQRIEAAGGVVVRIGGVARVSPMSLEDQAKRPKNSPRLLQLAVARSFGDLPLKKPKELVTSRPDINVRELTPGDDFAILACDGIWDVLSDEDVVKLATQDSLRDAVGDVVKAGYHAGSTDNISVIGIRFKWDPQ